MRIVGAMFLVLAMAATAAAEREREPIDSPPGMTPPLQRIDDVTEIQRIMGPPTAFFVGFGLGHVVEGRWHEKGWIFTLGTTVGMGALIGESMWGMECEHNCDALGAAFYATMLGLTALKIWETVDAVNGARTKHARYMQQQMRLGLHLAPPRDGSGLVGGLSLRF